MRHQNPDDISMFTVEIAGLNGSFRFYGTTDDVSMIADAIDAKGLIVGSVKREDAMSPTRAMALVASINIAQPAPVPEPEFDLEVPEQPKDKLDG